MKNFFIWVTKIQRDYRNGYILYSACSSEKTEHKGKLVVISTSAKKVVTCKLGYMHIQGASCRTWHTDYEFEIAPPFLISNNLHLELIFNSEILFLVDPIFRPYICNGRIIPICQNDCVGIIIYQKKFFRKEVWELIAFSNRQTKIQEGPVYFSQYPNKKIGNVLQI